MKLGARLCLALMLSGCASVPRAVSRHPEEQRASEAGLRELAAAEEELSRQQSAAAPACERICPLAENIRRLSALICELAQRHPDDEVLAAHCREAELHAARARTRIPPSCACAK